MQFVELLPLGVELFQVLQQAFELCRFLRRQVSEAQLALKIGFLGRDAPGLGEPVRRGDIRLPYPAVGLDGKVPDLALKG